MKLVFPKDCRELIHCGERLEFSRELASEWSRSLYFKVSGVTDAFIGFDLGRGDIDFHADLLADTIYAFPQNWKGFYQPNHPQCWSGVGRPQIDAIKKQKLQTLDRALMSLPYLVAWTERRKQTSLLQSFLEPIKVVPVLWVVAVENNGRWDPARSFWESCVEGHQLYNDLVAAVVPNSAGVIADALESQMRLTYRNAQVIADVLTQNSYAARVHVPSDPSILASNEEILDVSRQAHHGALSSYLQMRSS